MQHKTTKRNPTIFKVVLNILSSMEQSIQR
jgi:hypothetical protein